MKVSLLQVSLKFTFTKNGRGANSPKIAPCAHSLKLAGEPFYYQEMSQTPHTQTRQVLMSQYKKTLSAGPSLGIRGIGTSFLVKVNFIEMGL